MSVVATPARSGASAAGRAGGANDIQARADTINDSIIPFIPPIFPRRQAMAVLLFGFHFSRATLSPEPEPTSVPCSAPGAEAEAREEGIAFTDDVDALRLTWRQ